MSAGAVEVADACSMCVEPGWWCGYGTVHPTVEPCVVCDRPTYCHAACGAARCLSDHSKIPAVTGPRIHRPARAGGPPSGVSQHGAEVPETPPAVGGNAGGKPLRLLALLEGPAAPTRMIRGKARDPFWRPPLPGVTDVVHAVSGYAWKRPYTGQAIRLDRNAAYLSAASSVLVAHGELEHTGELPALDTTRAGYYLVDVHSWRWPKLLPSPLGHRRGGGKVWVPGPTVQLLTQLERAQRWGDVEIYDSYTAPGVRLTKWTTNLRDLRSAIITKHTRDSEQYADFKVAFGQAVTLLLGVSTPGAGRVWKCAAHRPDWAHAIHAQASATLWRSADACLAKADPGEGPVGLVNIDELLLPESAWADLYATDGTAPVKLDQDGLRLGTFKVKK